MRDGTPLWNQSIGTFVHKHVKLNVQPVLEETHFQTEVRAGAHFPGKIRVRQDPLKQGAGGLVVQNITAKAIGAQVLVFGKRASHSIASGSDAPMYEVVITRT